MPFLFVAGSWPPHHFMLPFAFQKSSIVGDTNGHEPFRMLSVVFSGTITALGSILGSPKAVEAQPVQ